MKVYWYQGNEEGWTDDLGIIADRNQWISYRPPGWYLHEYSIEVHEWCKANLKSYEYQNFEYCIHDERDVMLLKLRWPV